MMGDPTEDRFPALQTRKRPMDGAVDEARRVLWRAFQNGTLDEEEFATTLDRLESGGQVTNPAPVQPLPARGPHNDG